MLAGREGRGEGGRALDDDGGGVAAGEPRRAMGGVPRARTSMGNRSMIPTTIEYVDRRCSP